MVLLNREQSARCPAWFRPLSGLPTGGAGGMVTRDSPGRGRKGRAASVDDSEAKALARRKLIGRAMVIGLLLLVAVYAAATFWPR
jgi:hypothetical protein